MKFNFKKISLVGAIYFTSIFSVYGQENQDFCDYNLDKITYEYKLSINLTKLSHLEEEIDKIKLDIDYSNYIQKFNLIKANIVTQIIYYDTIIPNLEQHFNMNFNEKLQFCFEFEEILDSMDVDKSNLKQLEDLLKSPLNQPKKKPDSIRENNPEVPKSPEITQLAYIWQKH